MQPTPPESPPGTAAPHPTVIAAYVAGGLLLFASGVFLSLARPPLGRGAPVAAVASPSPPPSLPVDALPEFRSAGLQRTDGEEFSLELLSGAVVVAALFSTESPASLDSLPLLAELDQEFAGEQVEFLALCVDDAGDAREEVAGIAAGLEMHDAFAFVPYEAARRLSPAGQRGVPVPQVLVLTRGGRIARHLVGFRPEEDLPDLRAAVSDALRRPAVAPGGGEREEDGDY